MSHEELSLRIRFQAERANLSRVRSLIDAFLDGAPPGVFSREDASEIALALQECLSNSARHACPPTSPRCHAICVKQERL